MKWTIIFHPKFEKKFETLTESVQDEAYACLKLLEKFGPTLGRPHVDTLNLSKFNNMKELRFNVNNGVWRFAFAFDPERQAVLLVGGNKVGLGTRQFYRALLKKADIRFKEHLLEQEPVR